MINAMEKYNRMAQEEGGDTRGDSAEWQAKKAKVRPVRTLTLRVWWRNNSD